jgi:hypothetical protein
MRLFDKTMDTQEVAVAAIGAARELAEAMLETPYEQVSRHAVIAPLKAGQILLELGNYDPAPLVELLLGLLEEGAPGYRDIALHNDTEDFRFVRPDLEALRKAWARLDQFLWLRQRLLDYAEAERQLFKLNLRAIQRAQT